MPLSAGGILENPKQSQVVGKVGYAPAPIAVTPNGSHWLWSWAFAIPGKAKNSAGAKRFVEWATSKEYIKLVAEDQGWASVPPGTRKSTYENPEYQKAAPFAQATLKAMETADPTNPIDQKGTLHRYYFCRHPGVSISGDRGGSERFWPGSGKDLHGGNAEE